MPSEPRVLVYARYPALRAGLRELLASAGVEVAGELSEAALAGPRLADAIVADLAADAEDETLDAIKSTGLPLVLLVGRLPAGALGRGDGARGWLGRDAGAEEIAAAVRAVAAGMLVVDPALLGAGSLDLGAPAGAETREATPLTEREGEVLALVALGLPNKAIARRLEISEHTVKFHVASLLSKLGARSRAEAVATAARRGTLRL